MLVHDVFWCLLAYWWLHDLGQFGILRLYWSPAVVEASSRRPTRDTVAAPMMVGQHNRECTKTPIEGTKAATVLIEFGWNVRIRTNTWSTTRIINRSPVGYDICIAFCAHKTVFVDTDQESKRIPQLLKSISSYSPSLGWRKGRHRPGYKKKVCGPKTWLLNSSILYSCWRLISNSHTSCWSLLDAWGRVGGFPNGLCRILAKFNLCNFTSYRVWPTRPRAITTSSDNKQEKQQE